MKSKINRAILAGSFLVAGAVSVHAQSVNKFGTNSMTINSNAVLELESTTKGFLAPRMTNALRNTPTWTAADAGMLIYQTDANAGSATTPIEPIGLYQYNGTRWVNQINGIQAFANSIRLGVNFPAVGLVPAYVASQEMTLGGDAVTIDATLKTVTISANSAAVKTITSGSTALELTLTSAYNSIYVSGAVTFTLPDPATSSGRIYTFIKTDGLTLTFSRTITDTNGGTFTTTNMQKPFRLQSNGTTWYLLN